LAEPLLLAAEVHLAPDVLLKAIAVEKSRLVVLNDVVERLLPYQNLPDYEANLLIWKKADQADAIMQLKNVLTWLEGVSADIFVAPSLIETALKGYIETNQLGTGNVLWPTRVALSGSSASASPFELLWVLGKTAASERLTLAIEKLSA